MPSSAQTLNPAITSPTQAPGTHATRYSHAQQRSRRLQLANKKNISKLAPDEIVRRYMELHKVRSGTWGCTCTIGLDHTLTPGWPLQREGDRKAQRKVFKRTDMAFYMELYRPEQWLKEQKVGLNNLRFEWAGGRPGSCLPAPGSVCKRPNLDHDHTSSFQKALIMQSI